MTPQIPVGTVGFDGPRARTFARLQAVELQDSLRGVPGDPLLGRLRREAGTGFSFVLRLPMALTDPGGAGPKRPNLSYLPEGAWPDAPFDTGELGRATWQWVLGAAAKLGARALFLQTGTSFRPTAQNRRRLGAFLEQVATPRPARLVWDSQGLFAPAEQAALCRDLDLVPAVDPLVDPLPSDGHAYLRTVGRSRTRHGLSADELHLVAEAVGELAWGLLFLHTPNAYRDAVAVRKLLDLGDLGEKDDKE